MQDEKAFAVNGHIGWTGGILDVTLAPAGAGAPKLHSTADITTSRTGQRLAEHIGKRRPVGFIGRGIDIGDVVADDGHGHRIGIKA